MSVGIVILTKGNVPMLLDCLQSIKNHTKLTYNIYIGDTGSTRDEIKQIIEFIQKEFASRNVHLHSFNRYNFAKCNNHLVNNYVTDEYILLCNNDIVLQNSSIDIMYGKLQSHDNVGTVGCRLLYPDKTIQHAGQLVTISRNWATGRGHLAATHRGLRTNNQYKSWEEVVGNTGGFLLVSREIYQSVGGLNEKYKECFEDVEFNLQMIKLGRKNMYTDEAICLHYESVTRGKNGMSKNMLDDHSNNLTPFFNSLDIDVKNIILNTSKQSIKES